MTVYILFHRHGHGLLGVFGTLGLLGVFGTLERARAARDHYLDKYYGKAWQRDKRNEAKRYEAVEIWTETEQ